MLPPCHVQDPVALVSEPRFLLLPHWVCDCCPGPLHIGALAKTLGLIACNITADLRQLNPSYHLYNVAMGDPLREFSRSSTNLFSLLLLTLLKTYEPCSLDFPSLPNLASIFLVFLTSYLHRCIQRTCYSPFYSYPRAY